METNDTYKTIQKATEEVVFKDKGSKFIAYAFPISKEEDVPPIIAKLKNNHHKARHWCYAWKLDLINCKYRVNDDGEPNNSAGQPIYGQILSFDLTNILIVVVRYFGGIKLGVGGLINAYKTAAKLSLVNSIVIEKTLNKRINLKFEYKDMDKVMRLIKENKIEIAQQEMNLNCRIEISIRLKNVENILKKIENLRCVAIQ